jgi:hypothetical protein
MSNQYGILQKQPEGLEASQAPPLEKTPLNPAKGKAWVTQAPTPLMQLVLVKTV